MATDHQRQAAVAWAAGILDGEGCIRVALDGVPHIEVEMTHRATILRLQGILGGTVHSSQLPSGRTRWRWRMRTGDLQALLQECLPHLTTKAKEARAMLRYVYHRAHTHTRSRGRRNAIWRARNELTRLKRGPGVPR